MVYLINDHELVRGDLISLKFAAGTKEYYIFDGHKINKLLGHNKDCYYNFHNKYKSINEGG